MDDNQEQLEDIAEHLFEVQNEALQCFKRYIDEYKSYLTCKRKTEYMALLLATKGYCKNKSEAMHEIGNIKNTDTLLKYIDKIDKYISDENLLDILDY